MEFKDEDTLREEWTNAWNAASASFAEVTGVDVTKGPPLSPEQVLQQIKDKKDRDDADSARFQTAKSVLSKSLTMIELLGNIAAQGASMAFGPSTLCFNAVSYLIQAGRNYKNIFSSLAELFSRISDVLERFQIYLRMEDMVDVLLKRIVHQLLLCFINICQLSVKVLHKNKVFKFLKVFAFNDDDGVKDELAKLNALADKESQMKTTLILESVKISERNMARGFAETKEGFKEGFQQMSATLGKFAETHKMHEGSYLKKKQLDSIMHALGNPKEELYQKTYGDHISTKVEGTGQWLQQDPFYMSWADCGQTSEPILCISGDEGYGKTYLMSIIVQDLRRRYPQGNEDPSRVSVAYYYFERDAKNSQLMDRESQSIDKALKALAWQIAQNDPIYRKNLASSCGGIEDLSDIKEVWNRLFGDFFNTDATFYVLLDGINQIEEKYEKLLTQILGDIRAMSKGEELLRTRVLISGRVNRMESIKLVLDDSTLIIDLASKNRDDIMKFVRSRVDNMKTLRDPSPQVQKLKEEILAGLTGIARGDFINVDLLLKEIDTKQRPAEIRDVLARAKSGEQRSDTIAHEIERCNESLGDQNIRDLNELLTWVMCSFRPMSVKELEVVLFLRNHEAALRPLQSQIRERYSAFFLVERSDPFDGSEIVTLVSDSIKQYFRESSNSKAAEASKAVGAVDKLEVQIVKRFLRSVCDNELFEKFGFEEFFNRKLDSAASVVSVDLEAASLKMAMDCLQLLCSPSGNDTESLVDYASWYFPAHLEQVDLSLVDPHKKMAIGKELVKLFRQEEVIARWWGEVNSSLRLRWLYDDKYTDLILNWFKDSAVTKQLSEEDKDWARSLTSNSKSDTDLLEFIAKYMASKWLQSQEWEVKDPFLFVRAYISKIDDRKDPNQVTRLRTDPDDDVLKPSEISNSADWAAKQLGIENPDYECIRSTAETYRIYQQYSEAIREFKRAAALAPDPWSANIGLAMTYECQKEWQLAIQTREAVVKAMQDGRSNPTDQDMLHSCLLQLANSHTELGQLDKAMALYYQILKDYPDDYEPAFHIITNLCQQNKFAEVIEFLQQMKLGTDEKRGLDRLTAAYHELAHYYYYHSSIVTAAKKTDSFELIKSDYQTAIDAAKRKKREAASVGERQAMTWTMGLLLYFFGSTLLQHHMGEKEQTHGVELLEQIIKTSNDLDHRGLPDVLQVLSARKLSSIYLERAREAGSNSTTADYYITKLADLSKEKEVQASEWYSTADTKLLLGRCYQQLGYEEKAMNTLRGHIKISFELLSDEDPTNDWQGYLRLANTLMYFGDDENALAAWSLLGPIPPDTDQESKIDQPKENGAAVASEPHKAGDVATTETTDSKEDAFKPAEADSSAESAQDAATSVELKIGTPPSALQGPLQNVCDGRCGVEWTYANDFYVCRDCMDVQFDSKCKEALLQGELREYVCSKTHSFLYVPPYDAEKAAEVGKDHIQVGDKIMLISEWLDGIREQWKLPIAEKKTKGAEEEELKGKGK